ncbi:CRE-SRG-47 protein [Caenorhabditis remanei]|uniref:Serpentine receptor class gamma n=1 Tax=Caenorhabditis remanei TaxID=31234 RepID=E3LL36_CAERE|nr:CRE-SRG-47 protein [Caenorhabditis remanei]
MSLNVTVFMETNKSDRILKWIFIQMIYGFLTLTLMIYFLFLFGLSKKYTNSFYRVLQLDLLTNILCYINTWYSFRLENTLSLIPILNFVEDKLPGFLTFSKYFNFWFLHMQFLTAVSMSFNRLLSVYYPEGLSKWKIKYKVIIRILTSNPYSRIFLQIVTYWYVIYGLLLCVVSFLLLLLIRRPVSEIFLLDNCLMVTAYRENLSWFIDLSAFFSAAYFIILLLAGLIIAFLISKKVLEVTSSDKGVGKKLTRITVAYCFVYLGILLWSIFSSINTHYQLIRAADVDLQSLYLGFSTDMMTLSLPYILLIFDENVRKSVIPKRFKKIVIKTPKICWIT